MAQFGNPPWVRDAEAMSQGAVPIVSLSQVPQMGLAPPSMLSQPGLATPTIYSLGGAGTLPPPQPQQFTSQQIGLAALQQAALQQPVQLPHPGIAMPTALATAAAQQVGAVSYPAPRSSTLPVAALQQKQRVFTGTITKLHDNFGFVDEDVFFQMSCVKGQLPKVADRVLVEAEYNPSMPFKWNATRIQVLPGPGMSAVGQLGPSVAAVAAYALKATSQLITPTSMGTGPPPPLMGSQHNNTGILGAGRSVGGGAVKRSDGGRTRDRTRDRDRSGMRERAPLSGGRRASPPLPLKRGRSRSPLRNKSPSGRRGRRAAAPPRYSVQIPKISLDTREANVIALKSRYTNLYIPSDFFDATFEWVSAFPSQRPFSLCHAGTFEVLSKEVAPPPPRPPQTPPPPEPTDADHLYSAKVMLMSSLASADFYRQCVQLAEGAGEGGGGGDDPPPTALQHPTRLVQFLVGLKGKSEPMAIGGPWSAAADGADPAGDPSVLVRTAIRTTRALTGVDLSTCTQWYRFAEVRYQRPEEVHKGRRVRARVETVVIFLPDVWSCVPSRLEWQATRDAYLRQLTQPSDSAAAVQQSQEEDVAAEEEEETGAEVEKADPTHFSDLEPKSMKVTDLRRELECRCLSPKGLKSQLIARLTKATRSEQEKEDGVEVAEGSEVTPSKPKPETNAEKAEKVEAQEKEAEVKQKEDEDRRVAAEKERVVRERLYTLPAEPTIIVHPSTTAKNGRFDCTTMSLSLLLDYRPEDNKEHSFEVSLFAELFNEMMMRDCGFNIYRALATAPEHVAEHAPERPKGATTEDEKKPERKSRFESDDKKPQEPAVKKRKPSEEDKDEKKKVEKKEEKEEKKEGKKADTDAKDEADAEEEKDEEKTEEENDGDEDKEKSAVKIKEKPKLYTPSPILLMSCVYFDLNRTGYLQDTDVEQVIHMLGLRLSRAQIKKLIQKVVTRDLFHYRKLTDQPVEDADVEMADDTEKTEPKTAQIDDAALADGNCHLLMRLKGASGDEALVAPPVADSGMVQFRGSLLDVGSVMQQLERSEGTRTAVEARLKEIQQQLECGRAALATSEARHQEVALQLDEVTLSLCSEQQTSAASAERCATCEQALNRSRAALAAVLDDLDEVISLEEKDVKTERVKTEPVNGE